MAFLSGVRYDLFISYASVDDHEMIPGRPGWVSTFVGLLEKQLAQKIGRAEGFAKWFDKHDFHDPHDIDLHLERVVRQSALFLMVLSPGYITSTYCRQEFDAFCRRVGKDLAGRIYVIEKDPVAFEYRPSEIRNIRAYRFWYEDEKKQPRTYAVPDLDPSQRDYFCGIEDVARSMRSQLQLLDVSTDPAFSPVPSEIKVGPAAVSVPPSSGGAALPAPVQPSLSGAPTVFLAEVTDDLQPQRDEMRRFLDQQRIRTLPDESYPLSASAFSQALSADLAESQLFVQLLSTVRGKTPPDAPNGFDWLQLEMAAAKGLGILQWCAIGTERDQCVLAVKRELLMRPTVVEASLQSLKDLTVERLRQLESEKKAPVKTDTPGFVFINADRADYDFAARIGEMIGEDFDWALPPLEGEASVIRGLLESHIKECDSVVTVYGNTNPGWVQAQLNNIRKVAAMRQTPLKCLVLLVAPPEPKPPIGMGLRGLKVLDVTKELDGRIVTSVLMN